MKEFTMSQFATKEDLYKAKSEHLAELLKKVEKLAFDNVGAKTHEDADLALVKIHAIAKEA